MTTAQSREELLAAHLEQQELKHDEPAVEDEDGDDESNGDEDDKDDEGEKC